jgi:hypothetical protein
VTERAGRGPRGVAVFARLISHQPAVLFSQNKPTTSNQSAVLFSQKKPAPATSQPNRHADDAIWRLAGMVRRAGGGNETSRVEPWRENHEKKGS